MQTGKTDPSMKRTSIFLATLVLAACCLRAAEQPKEILLWPKGAPGSEGKTEKEHIELSKSGEQSVSSVHNPSITPYLPSKETATGAAVIVAPGGGHRVLAITHEGYNVAEWLSQHGIAAFVLKYRLARETNSTYKIQDHALADTQRAIQLVRSRAGEWGINPNHVGIMGFSAGGELAYLAGMKFEKTNPSAGDPLEKQNPKPDFQALIYPGRSGDIVVSSNSPPAFLACAYDDRPDISEGLAKVYLDFKKAGVRAELHIYAGGGHGFGFRPNSKNQANDWIIRFQEWLGASGFLK
jgi:acetyl esterase/lipase